MSLEQKIEQALELSDDELMEELPELLDELEGNADELVETNPVDVSRLMERIDESDIQEFYNEAPEVADRFQDFLWEVTETMVAKTPALQDNIDTSAKVNFKATDAPMEGHLIVDKENKSIKGGSGTLSGAELEIEGPAGVLVGMLTGSTDPVQSFMAGEFEMEGPVDKGMQLASVMTPINEELIEE